MSGTSETQHSQLLSCKVLLLVLSASPENLGLQGSHAAHSWAGAEDDMARVVRGDGGAAC